MSLHFEWTLSLRLRPDTPESFVEELRFHLGLTARSPESPTLDVNGPCLVAEPDDSLPGGEVQSLTPHRQGSLGLFVRTFVLDDIMYSLVLTVPPWLARWSATQGWIGQAREELSLHPWLNFYVQDGHAYVAEPGGSMQPLNETSPPFTLTQTSDT